MQKGNTGKKITRNYRCFNVIACNIHVEEFLATHYTLPSCRHRFPGLTATRRRYELILSDPVWCHGSVQFYNAFYRIQILKRMFKTQKACMQYMHSRGPASERIQFQSGILISIAKYRISVVNSKFRNYISNTLCSILNSRFLESTILKFSFIFINFYICLSV